MSKVSKKIVLKGLRSSFPHLFSKDTMSDKYTCSFILDKNHPQLKELNAAIAEVAADCRRANPGKAVTTSVLRDGDTERLGDANYAGKYFFKAGTSSAAITKSVFKRMDNGAVAVVDDESEFYGGCNCQASIVIAWYEFQGKYGVHALLNGVCREEGGEPFGSNGCSASDFGETSSEPEEDEVF